MAYYLPASSAMDMDESADLGIRDGPHHERMADLKVFWGPDICRLEYLVHLLDTGRIQDEYWPAAGN
jgi:hypothetical protein